MKLLLENWREYLKEQETIAVGQCYPFAVEMSNNSSESEFADLSKFKVVHGRVTDKFSGESVLHAWVEKGDIVFDSQTSRTKPNGIPKADYYDIYQPESHEEYTAEETILKCMKTGHKGPWNHINEVTTLGTGVRQGFRKAITDSKFWRSSNQEDDVDIASDGEFSTPAIEVLMDALNISAQEIDADLYFLLNVTSDEQYTLGIDDEYGGYPNNWMMRGQYRGPHDGKHIIWLEFRPLSTDYNLSDLNPEELVKKISLTISHELVHYNQLKKQAESKGISEEQAWEELIADPKQISSSDARKGYLTRHIEVDAFAHEAAEELLDKYSPDEALDIIRKKNGTADGIVGDYIATLGDNPVEIKKFWTKLYTQIQQQGQVLSEGKKVKVFRAQPAFTKVVRTNDYITMSRKFAGDHAVTSAIYNDEPFYVVYAFIDEGDIKEADNPGEYLYSGEPFEAKPSQMATPEGDLSFIRGRFNEVEDFQDEMKEKLPNQLKRLLKTGGNNTMVGPGIKNPDIPKFDSKPPGASGG